VRAHPPELGDADLRRPRVAVAADQFEIAMLLLRELRPRAKRIRDRLALAQLYIEAGDAYPALQLVVVPYSAILARGVDPKLADLWEVAWPRPFAPIVRESAPEGLEASVVWSVMREESGFRTKVESTTGAIGLLQIQPDTGTRLARELGIDPFTTEDLAEPQTNVRLGAYYLHRLAVRFDGRLAPAIASYNAGADAVSAWIESGDDPDSDVWIESIPYSQTRAYVKRVLRSLVLYRDLETEPPAAVAAEPAPGAEKRQKPPVRAADTTGDEAE
jgi:soluble lytic murein transglycosylase